MKQITENMFAFEVEQQDSGFKISGTNYLCSKVDSQWTPLPPRLGETGFEKFEILGTWQNGSADFDVEPYIEKPRHDYNDENSWTSFYDYESKGFHINNISEVEAAQESFTSLLISKGIDKDKKYVLLIKN